MTESEALEWFKGFYNADCEREDFEDTICADCNFPCKHGVPILRAIAALEEIQQYRAIGNVFEFRELKEKATAKKPIPYENTGIIECPHCYTNISDSKTKWCCICGQHLDWSEGKE